MARGRSRSKSKSRQKNRRKKSLRRRSKSKKRIQKRRKSKSKRRRRTSKKRLKRRTSKSKKRRRSKSKKRRRRKSSSSRLYPRWKQVVNKRFYPRSSNYYNYEKNNFKPVKNNFYTAPARTIAPPTIQTTSISAPVSVPTVFIPKVYSPPVTVSVPIPKKVVAAPAITTKVVAAPAITTKVVAAPVAPKSKPKRKITNRPKTLRKLGKLLEDEDFLLDIACKYPLNDHNYQKIAVTATTTLLLNLDSNFNFSFRFNDPTKPLSTSSNPIYIESSDENNNGKVCYLEKNAYSFQPAADSIDYCELEEIKKKARETFNLTGFLPIKVGVPRHSMALVAVRNKAGQRNKVYLYDPNGNFLESMKHSMHASDETEALHKFVKPMLDLFFDNVDNFEIDNNVFNLCINAADSFRKTCSIPDDAGGVCSFLSQFFLYILLFSGIKPETIMELVHSNTGMFSEETQKKEMKFLFLFALFHGEIFRLYMELNNQLKLKYMTEDDKKLISSSEGGGRPQNIFTDAEIRKLSTGGPTATSALKSSSFF